MGVSFRNFDPKEEYRDISAVHRLVADDLSEPYSLSIYFYFIKNWPELAMFAVDDSSGEIIGTIVGNLVSHHERKRRGYVAIVAVQKSYRGRGIAKLLIQRQVEAFKQLKADEVVLEAECANNAAVNLYESQGFLRTRRMHRYYSDTSDAFRLVLPISPRSLRPLEFLPPLIPQEQVRADAF